MFILCQIIYSNSVFSYYRKLRGLFASRFWLVWAINISWGIENNPRSWAVCYASKFITHCRFLLPGNTQKILTEIWHQFWHKNDDENICHWNYIQPERLVRPGQLAGNSERARGIWKKFQWHTFLPSFSCQNWCQISVRFFCVLPGIRNLQWTLIVGNN